MKKTKFIFTALGLLALTVISCTKDEEKQTDTNAVIASAYIDSVNELDVKEGNKVSYDLANKNKSTLVANAICGTLSTESTAFPRTYYLDFGTGCTTNNITRAGKLKITLSNYVTEIGSTMTVERENYYVNGNKVEGKITYVNTTTNQSIPQWTRTVTNGIFTDTNGRVYQNSGTTTVKQTAGVSTLTLDDNTYELITGTHNLTNQNNQQLTLTIVSPLVKMHTCDYVSKGQVSVSSAEWNGIIDYGNNECDNLGTYTQNGKVFPFSM
jgi:hypothetical protein